MILAWMGYAAGVGLLLAAGAWAGERCCQAMGWPVRFPWMGALALVVLIPLAARAPAPETPANPPSAMTAPEREVEAAAPVAAGPEWERAAIIAWAAASLATLVVFGVIVGAMAHSSRRWPRRSVDGGDVHVSERFGPALVGVARPKVVIPEWLLRASPRIGQVAILHEREHARARDHLILLAGALIAALFPWSPAIWWMVRNLRGAVEIDCDRRVIASGIPTTEYGTLLLAIGAGRRGRWAFAPTFAEPRHSLERRLKMMADGTRGWSPFKAGALGILSIAALVAACDTEAPTALDDALLDVLASPEADGSDAPVNDALRIGSTLDGSPPLIFLNGVELDGGIASLGSLDPDDIERIEVIKGPAAAALYGDRAEVGVIQIFTHGASDPPGDETPPGDDAAADETEHPRTSMGRRERAPSPLFPAAIARQLMTLRGDLEMEVDATEPNSVHVRHSGHPADWPIVWRIATQLLAGTPGASTPQPS